MFAIVASRCLAFLFACAVVLAASAPSRAADAVPSITEDGIVKVKSAYAMAETIARLRQDISSKGIMFFMTVDQAKLAAAAGIELRPSSLLIFGNPALGSQFMTSNPLSGLDWPVRLLVLQDENGDVWAAYTDFAYIARRHHIEDRADAFKMASSVIASITSSIAAK